MNDFLENMGDASSIAGLGQRAQLINQQNEILSALHKQNTELDRIKSLPKCPECMAPVDLGARLCAKCNTRVRTLTFQPPNGHYIFLESEAKQKAAELGELVVKDLKDFKAGSKTLMIDVRDKLSKLLLLLDKKSPVRTLILRSGRYLRQAGDSRRYATDGREIVGRSLRKADDGCFRVCLKILLWIILWTAYLVGGFFGVPSLVADSPSVAPWIVQIQSGKPMASLWFGWVVIISSFFVVSILVYAIFGEHRRALKKIDRRINNSRFLRSVSGESLDSILNNALAAWNSYTNTVRLHASAEKNWIACKRLLDEMGSKLEFVEVAFPLKEESSYGYPKDILDPTTWEHFFGNKVRSFNDHLGSQYVGETSSSSPSGKSKNKSSIGDITATIIKAVRGGYDAEEQDGNHSTSTNESVPLGDIWVMKPNGEIGGPFTKQYLKELKDSGKLPPGLKASRSKDGPWQNLQSG